MSCREVRESVRIWGGERERAAHKATSSQCVLLWGEGTESRRVTPQLGCTAAAPPVEDREPSVNTASSRGKES
jgi:hypothetical protein